MEVFVSGDFKITFLDTGETFSVRKPSSFVRNLVAGTKYLEVVGDMVITNEDSGESATIAFKEGSAWGGVSTRNKLDGKVLDAQGKTKVELVGRWDELVEKKEGKSNYTRLWVINDFPASTFLFTLLFAPFLARPLTPLTLTLPLCTRPNRSRTILRFLPIRRSTQRTHPNRTKPCGSDRFSITS